MNRPIIISLFLICLLMTSSILPFTNRNNSSNTAMAQEMGYYDDEEDDYNSDINYNSDEETYSDYQEKEHKYECRTGPFEGFFVSSVEFCKHVKFDDKDDRKKDKSRDDNNNKTTGTPTPSGPLGPFCSGIAPGPTNYVDHENSALNFKIKYPQDFTPLFGNPNAIDTDPTGVGEPYLYFSQRVNAGINCDPSIVHPFLVFLNIYPATGEKATLGDLKNFVFLKLIPRYTTFETNAQYRQNYLDEKVVTTTQGNLAYWATDYVFDITDVNGEYQVLIFFTIVEGRAYIITYIMNQIALIAEPGGGPTNFDIIYEHRIKPMLDSLCFPSNREATKQCIGSTPPPTTTPPTTPQKIVTEEWINTEYVQIPNFPSSYKVVISCSDPLVNTPCVNTPPAKIKDVRFFAGNRCITDPGTCDQGTQSRFGLPPSGVLWTAIAEDLNSPIPVWIIDAYPITSSPDKFTIDYDWNPNTNTHFEEKIELSLNKTTICEVNKPCQEIKGPAYTTPGNIYGPYTVIGAEVHTGVIVQQGNLVRTFGTGLVDFGGAVLGIGAPILGPDGDSEVTPSNYPAHDLRKNSLIVKIGNGGTWHQGGTDKSFIAETSGEIILRTNDALTSDNSRGWSVKLLVK